MHLIKLSATDSTNAYLKELQTAMALPDFSVVIAEEQLAGRGQQGAKWLSEKGKNLTFSVLKKDMTLSGQEHFYLNIWVSLALRKALSDLGIPEVRVKWPNDIMSGNSKICGILIENIWQGSRILHSVIGIGLNVNQTEFPGLPRAGSLAKASGREFDLDEVLQRVLAQLRKDFNPGIQESYARALQAYEEHLFYRDLPAVFSTGEGESFTGYIKGVSADGKLCVESPDGSRKHYGFKEILLNYP